MIHPSTSSSKQSVSENETSSQKPKSIKKDPFIEPIRHIYTNLDIKLWEISVAYQQLMTFTIQCNEAVQSKPCDPKAHLNQPLLHVIQIIQECENILPNFPCIDLENTRFGNKAFRLYSASIREKFKDLITPVLKFRTDFDITGAWIELLPYFIDSLGNAPRLDYGSGHELSFIMFLTSLRILGLIQNNELEGIVFRVYTAYLSLVRKIQVKYNLEPAGSRGVYGIDDYVFIPFLWGSSQLVKHDYIKPKSITNNEIRTMHNKEYLYLEAVDHIYRTKTGAFSVVSPMLYDISGVISWMKINSGMLKMFKAEVVMKRVVVQHLVFGNILTFGPIKGKEQIWQELEDDPEKLSRQSLSEKTNIKPGLANSNVATKATKS